MPQRDIIVPSVRIKDNTIFSLTELYKLLYRWFELHQYAFQEREYRDEDQGNGKKHIEIKWYAEKRIDNYFKYIIEIDFLILGLRDIEIEKDGVKVNTNKGDIEMRIKSYVLKDYDATWERSPIMRFFREVYDKRIIKGRIEEYEDELYEETYQVMDEAKAFLNLHRL